MRNFIIFLSIGLSLVVGVFLYAQLVPDEELVTRPTIQESPRVLGMKTQKGNSKKSNLPLKLVIDKDPVYLYWPQKITVETNPETEVRLRVIYPNGSINNSGTVNGYSDQHGKFVTTWTIKGNKDLIGMAKVEVSVGSLANYTESYSSFEIIQYQKAQSQPPQNNQTANPTTPSVVSPNSTSPPLANTQ